MTAYNDTALQQEQLSQMLKFNHITAISNILLAVLVSYELWYVVPQGMLGLWLASVIIITMVRAYIAWHYKRQPALDNQTVKMRLNIFRGGVMLSALAWGLSALMVYGHDVDKYELFVAYMIVGLSAGTAIVYLVDLVSALSYIYLAISPMMITFMFSQDSILTIVGVAAFAYVLFVTFSLKAFSRSLTEGIKSRWRAERYAKENERLAFYDELTGLPNRRFLLERLERAISRATRLKKPLAVMFLDLDKFKSLNDHYGHDMGDELLVQLAVRLRNNLREVDTVARLGGDEFVVVIESLDDTYGTVDVTVVEIAQQLLGELQLPYQLSEDLSYQINPSIGIAISSEQLAESSADLLRNADIAMYHAKNTQDQAIMLYQPSMEGVH